MKINKELVAQFVQGASALLKTSRLIGSFVLLQMCWWGINYLPSAQGSSVHTYSTKE